MKCRGRIKEKTKNGKTIERTCNNKLEEHQIFCDKCGEPTGALSGPLSAKQNYKEIWKQFKKVKSKFYPFAIFIILTSYLLIALEAVFGKTLAEAVNIDHYLLSNIIFLVIIPLALIPFGMKEKFMENPFSVKAYLKGLKNYPKYFLLTLVYILFFFVLKVLCAGFLLGISIDPILHPVRFILVLYWITIMLPSPILITRKNVNAFQAVVLCYKASMETRWQQFFLVLQIAGINVLGAALAGLGLLYSIPLSYVLVERYYQKLDEFRLFE